MGLDVRNDSDGADAQPGEQLGGELVKLRGAQNRDRHRSCPRRVLLGQFRVVVAVATDAVNAENRQQHHMLDALRVRCVLDAAGGGGEELRHDRPAYGHVVERVDDNVDAGECRLQAFTGDDVDTGATGENAHRVAVGA